MNWYTKSFRRHLCDMHIGDADPVFLSEFSPEIYVENLKKAHIQSAMLYFQSHIGLCYYPTKVGVMHKAFEGREDIMLRTERLCHENNIDVVGYYSIHFNTIEAIRHPEWQMVYPEGDTAIDRKERYGKCCPNNPDYRLFVKEQIKEMLEYFKVEGMFYDMPYWSHVCHCKYCKERFEQEHGGRIPAKKEDPHWHEFMRLREKWMGEFSAFCTAATKSAAPDVTVEQNYAFAAMKTDGYISEAVNDVCDYVGGDLYGGFWEHTFAQKYYETVTKNSPHEFMTSRCMPTLASHTTTKSFDRLYLSAALTVAHHGANFFIDAIDPVGTMDARVYELFGRVFAKTEPYEPYISDGEMICDIGLYYQQEGKENFQGQDFSNYDGTLNTCRNMIEHHIPVGVFSKSTVDRISRYKAVILSNPHFLADNEINAILSYVKRGGILYFSGSDEKKLLKELLGASYLKHTDCKKTYAAPKPEYESLLGGFNRKYPLSLEYDIPLIEGVLDSDTLATVTLPYLFDDPLKFSSIHSDPPGTLTEYPAIIVKKYGAGRVIWSAGPIEVQPIFHHKNILIALLKFAGYNVHSIVTDAPRDVEIIAYDDKKNNNRDLLSICRIDDGDEALQADSFRIFVRSASNPREVLLLPGGERMGFTYNGEAVTFITKKMTVFDMYEIKYE